MSDFSLPHWDVEGIFPSLTSPEFTTAFNNGASEVTKLKELFDAEGIRAASAVPVDVKTVQTFESIIKAWNGLLDRLVTLRGFIYAFVSTDANNDMAQAKLAELEAKTAVLTQLNKRLAGWLASMDMQTLVNKSQLARDLRFPLGKMAESAQHLMSEKEEELAGELALSGSAIWARLHGDVTSNLLVSVELPDGTEEMPMSAVRALANSNDAETRAAAYRAELTAWEEAAAPLAAALNGIKGEVATVSRRRGWQSPLDAALFDNYIDKPVLAAMQEAVVESFPAFRRYLKAKAGLLGREQLPWFDLFAPVPGAEGTWPFNKAQEFVVEHFTEYSPELSNLAERAFRENWVDAEPRRGKRDGAFCMSIRPGESRVLTNFSSLSFASVSTLAHELGHAYHNYCLRKKEPLHRSTPMVLAETASIFCQTLVENAALREVEAAERLSILENGLKNACQVVVDIHSRFLFEQSVFAARQERTLSIGELCAAMTGAQLETYGDGLDPKHLHPYMWAVKPHYYSASRSYYNFPYTFGLLFGLGLYAEYRKDPESFKSGYSELLSLTGSANPPDLAARFGIDISTPHFWQQSLHVIVERIDDLERIANQPREEA